MAAILNGLLPSRKKDQYAQERILNTRWGDAAISAPMHGGWSAETPGANSQSSPELDRDLPSTPPQAHGEQAGVYIVHDEEEHHDSGDEYIRRDNNSVTITIPLPWKKKQQRPAPTHSRKNSATNTTVLNPRFSQARRFDLMPPPLATAQAAAVPLPESRISSPVGRNAISPVLSFRTRLASPNLADMLSPVTEGFAKTGPSSRPTPVLSPLALAQGMQQDRPSTSSSMRSSSTRRASLTSYDPVEVTSQADDQAYESQRPSSRGLGATAHMRASSRGPRAPSVEPVTRRAETPQDIESAVSGILELGPVRRRAPSVEPGCRRAPSVEPVGRRAPSVGPRAGRRADSREARGRTRGFSPAPGPKVRFHSEAPRPTHRPGSFSSNDGSVESDSEHADCSETDDCQRPIHKKSHPPRRRRSIASPMTSPTVATFSVPQASAPSPQPAQQATFDSIAARVGLAYTAPPIAQRNAPRNRSQSRTRGLYGDMHDDFRLLARDVHLNTAIVKPSRSQVNSPAAAVAPSPISTRLAPPTSSSSVLTSAAQHVPSPALSTNPIVKPSGIAAAITMRAEPERMGYSSDSSLPIQSTATNTNNITSTNTSTAHFQPYTYGEPIRPNESSGGKALLAALARERKDQLRREERERAREKVTRKLERERERMLALNALSDCESVASAGMSGSEKTRRVYGGSVGYDSEGTVGNPYGRSGSGSGATGALYGKTMVPNAEEIWG